MFVSYLFDVNGFQVKAMYHKQDIQEKFLPLLEKLKEIQKNKGGRVFIFVAGPAGVGKTTLSLLLEHLGMDMIQSVGMDGFHYDQEYLQTHKMNGICLQTIKGHPDTFDVELLYKKLQEAAKGSSLWPIYSREIHDPIADAIRIQKDIVLLEGNYLLLDDERWAKIREFCEYSIFISCDEELVKSRLIERKAKGGLTYDEACFHYENSDSKNVHTILNRSTKADICFSYDGYRYYLMDE